MEAYTLNLKAFMGGLGFGKSFGVLGIGRLVLVWPLAWVFIWKLRFGILGVGILKFIDEFMTALYLTIGTFFFG